MVVARAAEQDLKRAPLPQPEVAGQGRTVNWWGILAMIASEVIFFANLIIGYLYLRVRAGQWPPEGIEPLELLLPTINTAILLSSALPMHGAHLAIRRGDRKGMQKGLILAAVLGMIFISGQAWEYTHAPFSLKSGTFGSTFFTLTGFHGLHVVVGIILILICYLRSLRGSFNREHHFGVEAAAMYWHFVDAVWVILFGVLYLL
ncbi:MAG: cytochrome c oxidase subunit 3 [Chloroflexota bacterium]|nr:cytochrome c oxidase subunit 3 [Chloroflexota bacterium]